MLRVVDRLITISGLCLACAMGVAQAQDDDLNFLFDESEQQTEQSSPAEQQTDPEAGEASNASDASAASESNPEIEANADATAEAATDTQPGDDSRPPPAGTTPPRASRSRLVEEIVVTAQRREENLADVPISIQAFSGAALDARGISDVGELQNSVPTLNVGESGKFTTIFLRGLGTDAFLTGDPSVAYYIDGIYFPFTYKLAQDFGKVERIEVLKGPQGTTFGRNAVAGAIQVITQEPTFDEFSGELNLGATNFEGRKARGYANVPVTDNFGFNVTGVFNEREQFENFTFAGERVNPDQEEKGGRLQLRWAPAEWADLKLTGFYLEADGPGGRALPNADPSPLGIAAGNTPQTGRDVELSIPIFSALENTVFYGSAKLNNRWFDTVVRASDQDIELEATFDFDGGTAAGPVFLQSQFGEFQTAELQFLSNDNSWGSEWLEWVGGAYYFTGEQGFSPILFAASSAADPAGNFGDPTAATIPPVLANAVPLPTGVIIQDSIISTDALSFYGQFTIDFTDWLGLTLGGRYQSEERAIEIIVADSLNSDGSRGPELFNSTNQAQTPDGEPRPPENTDRSFSPKAALNLRPFGNGFGPFGGDSLIYLSYQEATKAATYNPLTVLDTAVFVESEELVAYELGFKGSLFGGTTTLTAATFFYQIEGLQTQFIALTTGGATSLQNVPEAEVFGVDFDFTAQILPSLINDLVLTGGAGYLDSEYIDFSEARGFDPETGVFREDINATGRRINYSPEFTYSATVSKTWNLFGNPLETAVDWYHTDEYFLTSDNNPNFVTEAYDTFGARISYLYEPWDLRGTLFGQNLTDELYTNGCICNDFGFVRNLGPPRVYGARLSWNF